jgi:hypothetical protein
LQLDSVIDSLEVMGDSRDIEGCDYGRVNDDPQDDTSDRPMYFDEILACSLRCSCYCPWDLVTVSHMGEQDDHAMRRWTMHV